MREGMVGFATDTVNKENCFLPLAGRHTRYLRICKCVALVALYEHHRDNNVVQKKKVVVLIS